MIIWFESTRRIQPALHAQANTSVMDFSAWSYAKNRLPENILTNHVYLLSTMRPTLLTGVLAKPVKTRSRRRSVWDLGNGKSLVLLRDTHTDLNDFITNLCVHTIEARKIRRLVRSPDLVRKISKYVKIQIPLRSMILMRKVLETWVLMIG